MPPAEISHSLENTETMKDMEKMSREELMDYVRSLKAMIKVLQGEIRKMEVAG